MTTPISAFLLTANVTATASWSRRSTLPFLSPLLLEKSRRAAPSFRNRGASRTMVSAKLSDVSLSSSTSEAMSDLVHSISLADLDPGTARLAIGILGPALSGLSFLFILRIIMSWYPKLPVEKFPYVLAYAPTEPILVQTRKVIPPLAGVDVTPVVWFGLVSFTSEILVGPQGLLVLLSQQQHS